MTTPIFRETGRSEPQRRDRLRRRRRQAENMEAYSTSPDRNRGRLASSARALWLLQRLRRQVWILGQQLREHPICPSEADLQRIFAAPALAWVGPLLDIVLLDQHARDRVGPKILAEPPFGDFAGEVMLSISIQPFDRQKLQRGPAVRPVPLLAASRSLSCRGRRAREASRADEPPRREPHPASRSQNRAEPPSPPTRRRFDGPPAKDSRRRTRVRVPHQAPNRLAALVRARLIAFSVGRIAFQPIGFRQRCFEMHHQGVEIDRSDRRRADRPEILAVGEPAGTEIPSGLGAGAQVPVDLMRRRGWYAAPSRRPRRRIHRAERRGRPSSD